MKSLILACWLKSPPFTRRRRSDKKDQMIKLWMQAKSTVGAALFNQLCNQKFIPVWTQADSESETTKAKPGYGRTRHGTTRGSQETLSRTSAASQQPARPAGKGHGEGPTHSKAQGRLPAWNNTHFCSPQSEANLSSGTDHV